VQGFWDGASAQMGPLLAGLDVTERVGRAVEA